jgi:hypothetical protein
MLNPMNFICPATYLTCLSMLCIGLQCWILLQLTTLAKLHCWAVSRAIKFSNQKLTFRHSYMLHNQVTCNGKAAASSCLDVGQRQAMTATLLTIPAYPQLVGTGVCVVPTGLPTAPYPSERLPLPEQSLPPALHCSCLSLSGNCDQTWRCILQRPFMSPSQCNAAYMI